MNLQWFRNLYHLHQGRHCIIHALFCIKVAQGCMKVHITLVYSKMGLSKFQKHGIASWEYYDETRWTLFMPTGSSLCYDLIRWVWVIEISRGQRLGNVTKIILFVPEASFNFANGVVPDKLLCSITFRLCLYCLYLSMSCPVNKASRNFSTWLWC